MVNYWNIETQLIFELNILQFNYCLLVLTGVFMKSSGFSTYKAMSPANKDECTSSFPMWMLFLFFLPKNCLGLPILC